MLKIKEQSIVNAIWETLCGLQIPAVHIRNTGTPLHRDGKIFFGRNKFDQKGAPDIIALVAQKVPINIDGPSSVFGVGLAIEVKSATGRVSPEQEDWLLKWRKNGGHVVVARSVDDVLEKIHELTGVRV